MCQQRLVALAGVASQRFHTVRLGILIVCSENAFGKELLCAEPFPSGRVQIDRLHVCRFDQNDITPYLAAAPPHQVSECVEVRSIDAKTHNAVAATTKVLVA